MRIQQFSKCASKKSDLVLADVKQMEKKMAEHPARSREEKTKNWHFVARKNSFA